MSIYFFYFSLFDLFCSETIPTTNDIENFKESLILQYFYGSLIGCFPFSKTQINFGNEYQPKWHLQNLFVEIFKTAHDFIPSDTVTTLSEIVIEKNEFCNEQRSKIFL